MITKKQLLSYERLLETEKYLVEEYDKLRHAADEPQLKSEFQNIIASHKNHMDKLVKELKKLENQ